MLKYLKEHLQIYFLYLFLNDKKLLAVKINELPQKKKPCYYKNVGINKGSYESNVQNKTEKNQSGQKWTETDRNDIIIGMESTQDKIIYLVKENPRITQIMMSNKLGVARSTISSNIQKMKEQGILKRVGSDRNGYWKVLL